MSKLKKLASRMTSLCMHNNEDARVKANGGSGGKSAKAHTKRLLMRLVKTITTYGVKQAALYAWENREVILAFIGGLGL